MSLWGFVCTSPGCGRRWMRAFSQWVGSYRCPYCHGLGGWKRTQ